MLTGFKRGKCCKDDVCVGSVVVSEVARVSKFLFVFGSRARRLGLVSREASRVL